MSEHARRSVRLIRQIAAIFLFPKIKTHFKEKRFKNIADIQRQQLKTISFEDFHYCSANEALHKLGRRLF